MPKLLTIKQALGEVGCGKQPHELLGNGFNPTRFSRKHD
jgi:hypothetical protein